MSVTNLILLLQALAFCLVWRAVSSEEGSTAVWFIWPTLPATENLSCPTSPNQQPCYSLQEIFHRQNLSDMVFQSNTKLVFLSGLHELEFENPSFVLVSNAENLTMQGDGNVTTGLFDFMVPATQIVCRSPVGMAFINITNFSLANLTISNCGANISDPLNTLVFIYLVHGVHVAGDEQKAALFIVNSQNLQIEHCTIQNSKGFGLLGVNTLGNTVISRSTFIANNIYTLNTDRCQYKPVARSDYTACNGGNALLVFEDFFDCPSEELQYTLTVNNTVFALGIATYAGQSPEVFLTRGTGLGVILSQSSYGVDVTLNSVISYGNGAMRGANFYFGVYEVVRNSSIALNGCSSGSGNNILVRSSNFLQVSGGVSAGLHLEYGISTSDSAPQPVCSGAVLLPKEILRVTSSTFVNNSASTAAGMYISLNLNDRILGRFREEEVLVRVLVEDSTFVNNQGLRGIGMFVSESRTINVRARALVMVRNSTFSRNSNPTLPVRNLTGIMANFQYSVLEIVSANVSVTDVNFLDNEASAMALFASTALFSGEIIFHGNSGVNGGGIDLQNSYIFILPNTNVRFTNNFALRRGGAINTVSRDDIILACFFQVYDPKFLLDPNVNIYFENNYAGEAGSLLYGGSIDSCFVEAISSYSEQPSTFVFDQITTIGNHSNDTSLISSEPIRVCSCTNGLPDCSAVTNAEVHPGGTFNVSVAALGQRNGTTPAIIYAIFTPEFSKTGSISQLQGIQQTEKSCSNLTFTVQTNARYSATIILVPSENLMPGNTLTFFINIVILTCPTGFVLQDGVCVCDPVPQLANYKLVCNLQEQTVTRPGGGWINATYDMYGNYTGLIVHTSCPYDYCMTEGSEVNLDNPDTQCNFNRTGILCGACRAGFSVPLSTSQCKSCSNASISLVIAYAIAGVCLVLVLFLLNLTLTMGTLSGLIFYANIVRINQSIFFPTGSLNFVTVFIAWLNLDPGTDYCFFDGMDNYARTWLNYAFPLYIWFIVGVIILVSRYSTRVARVCGSNAVPVLATLILLSYTKLIQAVLFSLTFTSILLPDGTNRFVWSSDGNINFFRGKHIPLGVFSNVVLVFFIIPYSFFLFLAPTPCGQFLTKYRLLGWINKLKPFLDSHTGHYKDHYRFWTGLLLLVRLIIAVLVSINFSNIVAAPMLVVAILMFLLTAVAWINGGVYKKWPNNLLECSFFVNLGIFSVSTVFVLKIGGNQEAVFYTSGTIALLEFFGIIFYHVYFQINKLAKVRQWRLNTPAMFGKLNKGDGEQVDLIESTHQVTSSDVGLRESLLA